MRADSSATPETARPADAQHQRHSIPSCRWGRLAVCCKHAAQLGQQSMALVVDNAVEWHTTWKLRWKLLASNQHPKLLSPSITSTVQCHC